MVQYLIPDAGPFAPLRRLRRRWGELSARRGAYTRRRDWLVSFYDTLLKHARRQRWPLHRLLPLRGRVYHVHLSRLAAPCAVRLGTTDWEVLEEVLFEGVYDAALDVPCDSVRLILDLGANAGLSVRFWHAHFPEAQIVAVEPDAGNLAVCRLNAEAAGPRARICTIQACAAGTTREVSLDYGRRQEQGIRMAEPGSDGAAPHVAGLRVPEILERAGAVGPIDILKCDIEGAEAEVFRTCADWIERVRNLLIELHPPLTAEAFRTMLQAAGWEFEVVSAAVRQKCEVMHLRKKRRAPVDVGSQPDREQLDGATSGRAR